MVLMIHRFGAPAHAGGMPPNGRQSWIPYPRPTRRLCTPKVISKSRTDTLLQGILTGAALAAKLLPAITGIIRFNFTATVLPMIAVDNLIFEYPGVRALDRASFTIPQGRVTALVGPNGAGKTTLLRCMAALEQPVSGRIEIGGIDVLEQPRACHRIIGYLSDFFGLYQRLTVRQCLHYVARAQGIAAADCPAAIADVARSLQIEDRLDQYPGELSRGLRQRLAIAQAIIHKPAVVLLDEPASGLDPEARHQLAELFLQLQRQGMTLVVSSHILAELEAYSSDMLVLRQGRIVEHAALNAPAQHKPFRLQLAAAIPQLADILRKLPGLELVRTDQDRLAIVNLESEGLSQHRALKALLDAGLPVCEFAPAAVNLQDAYLQTLDKQP